jgi:hypothetical protein
MVDCRIRFATRAWNGWTQVLENQRMLRLLGLAPKLLRPRADRRPEQ